MRAAANKPNINIVAVNDPFIPVDYSEFCYIPASEAINQQSTMGLYSIRWMPVLFVYDNKTAQFC